MIGKRRIFQLVSALAMNAYIPGFFKGTIFQGKIKGVCVPALNCYSCPAAIGACPIGAMQNFFLTMRFNFSLAQYQVGLYVLGTLGVIGSAIGRIPCGWLCPFGFFQEMMHKIPSPKLSIPRFMSYFRYVILALFVIILPFLVMDEFGVGQTWFCKFICPAGTLEAGVPLVALNSGIRSQVGTLYFWKLFILVLFLIWMVLSRRPFCRTTCPLGAIFGLFNKVSLFRMYVDENRCVQCNDCLKDCPVEIKAFDSPNTPDCIRCLKCAKSCQHGAVTYEFFPRRKYASEQALKA